MNIVLFGPPGSGKGTQSNLLVQEYGLTHLSTGDAFRAAIRARSPLGMQVKECIERGELVSDELVTDLVRETVGQFVAEGKTRILFDGYPRTTAQVGHLDSIVEEFQLGQPAVVNLDVPTETLFLRITGRRICLDCKATYNVYFQGPKLPAGCDFKLCRFTQRVDDTEATVQERLRVYEKQTKPVLLLYEMRGSLANIDGSGKTRDVFARIQKVLSDILAHQESGDAVEGGG